MIREISLCDFSFDEIFNYIKRLENSFIKNNSMINAVYIEFKEKGTVIISKMSEGAITKLLDLTKDLISFAEIPIITYYILKEKKRIRYIQHFLCDYSCFFNLYYRGLSFYKCRNTL